MTRRRGEEPGNDVLSDQLRVVISELRSTDEEEQETTFRAVIRAELVSLQARIGRLESRQDAILLLILGGIVVQVLAPLLGGGR